ncbi:MAG: nucleotidyltransferase domain-containing protein [Chitinophagaceae bacterium]
MKEIIIGKLSEIEREKSVRILYACESGSRAWGFHSPDSDYDVRFIYVHDKNWYLGIEDKKDHLEFPITDELDILGYDLRKMLKLFRGSNAKIYEWLQSPVVYRKDDAFLSHIHSFMPVYYSLRSGIHHYLGLTKNTFDNELQQPEVKLKKYFYALRPVLAATWITNKQSFPPMEFAQLRTLIKGTDTDHKIEELLQKKIQVGEGYVMQPDMDMNEFIRRQMDYCLQAAASFQPSATEAEPLNQFFRNTIGI